MEQHYWPCTSEDPLLKASSTDTAFQKFRTLNPFHIKDLTGQHIENIVAMSASLWALVALRYACLNLRGVYGLLCS